MTWVSFVAVLLSLAALPLSTRRMTVRRLAFAFFLLVIHLSTTWIYYNFSLSHPADTAIYYYDLWHFNSKPWTALGTVFTIHLTQLLKHAAGATYFDCFLIFQVPGFLGIMLLSRTLEEVHARIGANDTVISKCLLLLPTIHYWTSAIGKDSLLFLAITLCIWSTLNLSRRILYFGFALFLMLLTRVHIALVVVASLSIAATFYRGLSLGRRIMLLAPAAAAVVVLVLVVRTSFGVNLADAGSIANFLAERSAMWQLAAGNASIYGASYPVKLVSLLVRPMFVDARNAFGVVASVENLIVLTIILTCVVQWRKLLELYKKVFFIRFALIATIGLILLLAIANYNVGLGLRQRTMFFPSLLSVFAAVWAYSSRLRRERQRPVGEPLIHAPLPSHAMTALDAGPQLSKS